MQDCAILTLEIMSKGEIIAKDNEKRKRPRILLRTKGKKKTIAPQNRET